MIDFAKLEYSRPDVSALKKELKSQISKLRTAKSYPEAKIVYFDIQKTLVAFETAYSLAYIRNTLNTADPFYESEIAFFNKAVPQLSGVQKKFSQTMLETVYRPDFELEYGGQMFELLEADERFQSLLVVPEQIMEANLETRYSKLVATRVCDFRGERCNLYGLQRHMQSPDREVRRAAFKEWSRLYSECSAELDKIYDKLVSVRSRIAKRLGFENYIESAYIQNHRFDYGPSNVAAFRAQILEQVVPLCVKLRELQAKRIGVDKLRYYDETLMFKCGNPTPSGSAADLVHSASELYRALGSDTFEFFSFLKDGGLFDLETKENKHLGGYCTSLPSYKAPFIFSNFNGTSADVDVLTHECGHAFQYYRASRIQSLECYVSSTSEINEIHSSAMEFFAFPWLGSFFGDRASDAAYYHLCDTLFTLPYIACVDEFQHLVYTEPRPNAARRRELWRELEHKYLPWRDYDGDEFLESGGFWMQKQHIFLFPFYYIDYALAQICTFELCGRMKKNFKSAWKDYLELCSAGGSRGYLELLSLAKLHSPFTEGSVKAAVSNVIPDLLNYHKKHAGL
ncbi:MAG: M3 family oligoendopeptidase [Oscillospiraceae bacterium]